MTTFRLNPPFVRTHDGRREMTTDEQILLTLQQILGELQRQNYGRAIQPVEPWSPYMPWSPGPIVT